MDEDLDDWESEDDVSFRGIFTGDVFSSVEQCFTHHKTHFGVDLVQLLSKREEENIMLVNYLRKATSKRDAWDVDSIGCLIQAIAASDHINEDNLRPVLADDQLLFLINDYVFSLAAASDDDELPVSAPKMHDDTAKLQADLIKCKAILQELTATDGDEAPTDKYYFDGYSNISIHEIMLRDAPRTEAYLSALSSALVKDKIVLDVGCGTGILSLFAARSGASKVVGIECGSIARHAANIVRDNGFSNIVEIVQGRLEELPLQALEGRVDVIVSEWMGYGLYFENMLSSVLVARDRFLKPGGCLVPSSCSLEVCAVSCSRAEDDRLCFWRDVYGFRMSEVETLFLDDAQVQLLYPEDYCSTRATLHTLVIKELQDEDLDFNNAFAVTIQRDCTVHALALTFDVELV